MHLTYRKKKCPFLDLTVVYIWHTVYRMYGATVPATVHTDTVRTYGRTRQQWLDEVVKAAELARARGVKGEREPSQWLFITVSRQLILRLLLGLRT